jgi:N-acyl-D-amino-acid deacylase
MPLRLCLVCLALLVAGRPQGPVVEYDVLIRGGLVYDGSGQPPRQTDVAMTGDRIAAVGDLRDARGRSTIDAGGLAVAPGFINMLSQAAHSLMHDGRSQGDIRQGVTLEVLGERAIGPLNADMRRRAQQSQSDIRYPITWSTVGEHLEALAGRGISPNVAAFVGAEPVRIHELGYRNRAPTAAELARMRALVRQAMEEGAMGLSSALIYAPGTWAATGEIVALAQVAAAHGGMYVSHLRSEGNRLLEGIDELIDVARQARVRAEIYHVKAAGEANWPKLPEAIRRIEAARRSGLEITANMYTYTAGSTGLDAAMPPWAQEGGYRAWADRLREPALRARIRQEMTTPTDAWENLLLAAGPDRTLLVGFKNEALRPLAGKTLAEVARMRGTSPPDTAMDLVIEDGSRVQVVYFLMSEEDVRRLIALPWIAFGSDAASMAAEGVFLRTSTHPRAYGNVARLLGRYVRDESIVPLAEAVRRLTSFPAANLRIPDRGLLKTGYVADVVVFDPATIHDTASYDRPHQYAEGVAHVWVNGVQVLREGAHTGATPGRVVRGPGWTGGKE